MLAAVKKVKSTPLTDTAVRNAKSSPPRKISDGKGLYLEVTSVGSKLWRMAYRFPKGGKQRTLVHRRRIPCRDVGRRARDP